MTHTAHPSWFPPGKVLVGEYLGMEDGKQVFVDEHGRVWRFEVGEVEIVKCHS